MVSVRIGPCCIAQQLKEVKLVMSPFTAELVYSMAASSGFGIERENLEREWAVNLGCTNQTAALKKAWRRLKRC